jgi:co-chaperonin GroES (HSP10)
MGQAKRKKEIREHSIAKTAIERRGLEVVTPVEKFNRDNWDASPDTCFVRRDPEKTIASAGGVVVGGKKVRQDFGTVEVSAIEWLKPGDRVLFSKYGGTDVELDDTALVHLHKLQIYSRKRAKDSE